MSNEAIRQQAEAEYREELFREAVEAYKVKLRFRATIWDRIFPWRIILVRKKHV